MFRGDVAAWAKAEAVTLQFQRLLAGQGPIKPLSDEDLEYNRLAACVECEDEV